MLKKVVHFNLSICPMCGSEMYLLESRFNTYGLSKEGTYTNRKIDSANLTHLMCSKCDFMTRADHYILGVIPRIVKPEKNPIDEGTKYRHLIGYVEK
jgi:hypothetical protein